MSKEVKQDLSDNVICNDSGNLPFAKILEVHLSRRNILKGGLGAASTAFFQQVL